MPTSAHQEEVKKLKAAASRTNKSSLGLVSSTMNANAWWQQEIWTYLKQLPALNEWAPRLQSHYETLDVLNLWEEAHLESLHVIVKEIYVLGESLHKKVIVPYEKRVLEAAQSLCTKAISVTAMEAKQGMVEKLQLCLSELVCQFPDDDSLQALQQALTQHLQGIQEEKLSHGLEKCCLKLVELWRAEDPEPAVVMAGVCELNEATLGILSPVSEPSTALCSAATEAWECLVEILSAFWLCSGPVISEGDHNMLTYLLDSLAGLVGSETEGQKEVSSSFEAAALHQVRFLKLRPSETLSMEEVMGAEDVAESIKGIVNAKMQVETVSAKMVKNAFLTAKMQKAWEAFLKMFAEQQEFMSKVGEKLKAKAAEELDTKMEKLKACSGGRVDGTSWAKQIKNMSWRSQTKVFTDGQLFTVKPEALVKATTSLDEETHVPRWIGV